MTEQQRIMKEALQHYKKMLDGHIQYFRDKISKDRWNPEIYNDLIDIKYRKLDIIDEMLEGFK